MKEPVLVTGGSGFIGTHLIAELARQGHDVINLDIQPPKIDAHRRHWRRVDVTDGALVTETFRRSQPAWVVHLAARTDTDSTDVADYEVNVSGTANVLAAAFEVSSVHRLILTSSQFVVGPGPMPASDADFRPHTAYGLSKVRAELLAREAPAPCTWTIVRPTNIWGPWHPRYPHEFWRVLHRGMYFHPGSRPVVRSYGYVGNVVQQMLAILRSSEEAVHGRVLYVGDAPVDLLEWVHGFAWALTGRPARVVPRAAILFAAKLGDAVRWCGLPFPIFTSRYRSMVESYPTPMEGTFAVLGHPPFSMQEGIEETVRWLRSQGGWGSARPSDAATRQVATADGDASARRS